MLNNYFSINLYKKAQNAENEDVLNPQNNPPPEVPLPNEQPPANQQPANQPPANQQPANQPPANQIVQRPKGNRVLVYLGEKNWGKARTSASIKLKGLTQKEYIALENAVKKYIDSFRATGKYPDWLMSKPKNANDIRFKSQPQSFFIFSKNQEVEEGYYVVTSDQECFNMMIAEFEKLGYDTTPLSNAVGGQQGGQLQAEKPLEDPSVVEATNVDNDVLSIRFTYNAEVINFIMKEKIVKHPNIRKPVASCLFSIKAGNVPSQLVDLASFMKSKGYNIDQFSAAIEKFEEYFDKNKISKIDKNKVVVVKNVSGQTKFLLEIVYPDISEELKYNEMKDFVMFSFPSKGNETDTDLREYKLEDVVNAQGHITGQRGFFVEPKAGEPLKRTPPTGMRLEKFKSVGGKRVVESSLIYGEYDDLVRFGFLLRNRSWDVSQYRNALALLIKGKPAENGRPAIESRVKITRYSGEPDGYKVLNENGTPVKDEEGRIIFDDKKFFSDIDSLIARKKDKPDEPVIKLFYKQKQGIAWLYQRNSAILGDNTGCGKTISCIDAAAMRIKQNGGQVLVFTPKATQVQWVNEIENHLRDGFGNVSTDPTSDADWIVLSYSNVSSKPAYNVDGTIKRKANGAPIIAGAKGKNVQKMLDALFDKQWTVVIFDEAHQLKKDTSAKATNISLLGERIPFKWGATATPAANNASDVHNILKCCGHTLGKLPSSDFRSEFIGGKGSMKNLSNKEQALLMLQKAHNLNKWLTLSGVYLKRSMKSMNPDIPDHNITEHNITDINFDMEKFRDGLQAKLDLYGHTKANILVQLMAERMTLANQKVPHTIKEAIDIIRTGGKVLVFSCFKTSCEMLFNSLQKYFSGQLEGYNQPEDEVVRASGYKVVQITDKIKNSRGIQSAIDGFKGVVRDRNGRVREDENSPVRAMVVSALKGGTGVSLENSTEHVLINDFDWMPAVCQQVEGRAYRINNVFPVNTRYMVVRGTGVDADGNKIVSPDEKFYNYVRTKISISDAIQQLDEKIEEGLIAGNNVSAEKAQLLEEQMRLVENKEDLDRWVNDLAGIPLDQGSDIDEIIDDLYEAEQEKKGNEDDGEPDVKIGNIHGWYKQAFDIK